MKTGLNIIVVIMLLGCLLIALYSFYEKSNTAPAVGIILDDATGKMINQASERDDPPFWNNYPVFAFQAENKKLDPSTIVYDTQLKPLPINTLINGKTVFFRYSLATSNEEAVDSTLKYLDQLNNQHIVILVSADNNRYFKFKIRNDEKLAGHIYFIEKPGFNLLIEKKELPFLFTTTPDLKITNVYVPRKEIPEVTQKYLHFQLDSSHSKIDAN